MASLKKTVQHIITPEFQLAVATAIILSGFILLVSACLRFVPLLDKFAIAKTEPFWVLILSIAALIYAGLSALPAALAYKEVKK